MNILVDYFLHRTVFWFGCVRYQMQDYDGKVYNEANAKRHTLPSTFIQSFNEYISARKWQERSQRQQLQQHTVISLNAVSCVNSTSWQVSVVTWIRQLYSRHDSVKLIVPISFRMSRHTLGERSVDIRNARSVSVYRASAVVNRTNNNHRSIAMWQPAAVHLHCRLRRRCRSTQRPPRQTRCFR